MRLHFIDAAVVLLGLFALVHCGNVPGGDSIGRPSYPRRVVATTAVQITQVSLNPNAAFVQLQATQEVDLRATPWHLLTANGDVDLSGNPNAVLAADVPTTLPIPTLAGLHWGAGEVLLTDAAYVPLAYFAWGNSPENFDTGLAALALDVNVTQPGFYVPVPLVAPNPLPTFAVQANQRGCLDASQAIVSCGTNPNFAVQITAVAPLLGGDPNISPRSYAGSWITLRNNLTQPLDIYGLLLCRGPQCTMLDPNSTLNPNYVLNPNSAAQYYLGQTPDPNATGILTLPNTVPSLRPPYLTTDEELTLVAPGPAPQAGDPSTVVWSYVRMGSATAPVYWAGVASAEGLWGADAAPVAAPVFPNTAVVLDPNFYAQPMVSAANWSAQP